MCRISTALCSLIPALVVLLGGSLRASTLLVTMEHTPDASTSLIFNGGAVSNIGTLTWTITTDTTNPDLNPAENDLGIYAVSSITLLAPGLGINTATAVTSSGLAYYMFDRPSVSASGNGFVYGYPGSGALSRAGYVNAFNFPIPFADPDDLSTWTGATGPYSITVGSATELATNQSLGPAALTLANGDFINAGQFIEILAGSGSASVTFSVPEPSFSLLLLANIVAVLLHRRRG